MGKIYMTLHSTNHNGGNGQQPNADFTKDPLIAGFEWNVRPEIGQIDLTWWMTWFDISSQSWVSHHTTKVLFEHGNNDYYDFYDSFNGEGFSLLLNLAEGGDWPSNDVFVDNNPQYMNI